MINGTVSRSACLARGGFPNRAPLAFPVANLGLGAFATVILAIPFVGYILGMRKRPVEWLPWARSRISRLMRRDW